MIDRFCMAKNKVISGDIFFNCDDCINICRTNLHIYRLLGSDKEYESTMESLIVKYIHRKNKLKRILNEKNI